MSTFKNLTSLYAEAPKRTVKIAHRGASGLYPENTALAMRKALALGADMIEFDLRLTKDHVPVLLHDRTIDRTSDGKGTPEEYTLRELQKFNFSYRLDLNGARMSTPMYENLTIPTFEEILDEFHGKCAMNIQVYDASDIALREICRLFRRYQMFDIGFLAMSGFEEAEKVREMDAEVEVAVLGAWDKRATAPEIRKCHAAGCRFIQPPIEYLTQETIDVCRELGMHANVFFSDTEAGNRRLIQMGADGILTNRIDLLADTVKTV